MAATVISQAQVEKLAGLAHLELTADEAVALTADLNRIVGFVDRIKAAEDPSALPAVPTPSLPLAQDRVHPSLDRPTALSNAPNHTDAAVVAPPLEAAENA